LIIILTASDFYTYLRPSKCGLRVYLKHRGEEEAVPGPYEEVLQRLGMRHEKSHLNTFPAYDDLSVGTIDYRERQTKERVAQGAPVLYQPVLRAKAVLDGIECEIIGDPDFLINEECGYVIRDSKISRRITEKDHPEILRQLELYGWLYEQAFGQQPSRLQVHSGTGEIVTLPYDGSAATLEALKEILALKLAVAEPYDPVGWTKCGNCSFRSRCWSRAEESGDIALVMGVDKGLAKALWQRGIRTVDDFLAKFDEKSLAEFQRPWGERTQRVGKNALKIMRMAQAMASGKESLLQVPQIPEHDNYVMFDLEGLPPHLDELEKIYLWGLQVFGKNPGFYQAALAGFGVDGDRQGWNEFLVIAREIFQKYGDIPFVHWHRYEQIRLEMYMDRYGDPEGVAARVHANLLDLLPITQRSLALPLPSYSLKMVEEYIGFKRTLPDVRGDWAMAKYIEATETENENLRDKVLNQIRTYNKEDLEATWEILKWLKSRRFENGN
jgi:predicted RecB family nuclease